MGHGSVPASTDEVANPVVIDEGTLTRTESPTPDAVGLDERGGSPAANTTNMADRIVSYARRRRGQRVGDGECFTLVDRALRSAGALSAADHGEVTPDADYIWGTEVNLSDVRPGDVIQFRDYRYDRVVEVEETDGWLLSATSTLLASGQRVGLSRSIDTNTTAQAERPVRPH